jgi:CzcA family heavy metal efflux pump
MFGWIIGSSLKYRFLVLAAAVAIMLYGATSFQRMPVDVFPEFAPPTVEIQTEALGLSAAEVESLITLNLEELLAGVPWLKSIRSQSITGLSSVVMIFEPGTDIMRARQVVQERLTLAYTLPNVSKPPVMLQPVSAANRVMMIAMSSDKIPLMQLSVLARWTVVPKLSGVSGVANVAVWGSQARQLQVHVDTARLREFQLSQEDVFTATGDSFWMSPLSFLKASTPGAGGWIDGPNQRLGIQHSMPIAGPEDLARVPLKINRGQILKLGEVVEVVDNHSQLIGSAIVNDRPGLLLVIHQFPGANTLDVTRGVEAALAELSLGLPGVTIDTTVYRQASYIEAAIKNHKVALLIGAILAVVALGAFLADWRSALITAVAVPASVLVAGVVLYLTKTTLNSMVLAGYVVALAAVIDDGVVYVQNIQRHLRRERETATGKSTAAIILAASLEIRGAIVYATLVVLLAVTPVYFLGGVSGAFLRPLVVSYALALLASMAVAATITPALCLLLLKEESAKRRESRLVEWLRRRYDAVLSRIVQAPRSAYAAAAVVAVAGFAVLPLIGQSLLPAFKERELVVHWVTAPGTSQQEMYRIVQGAGQELRQIPGVRKVSSHVGRAVSGDQVVGVNSSQLWVSIDPQADYEPTVAAIQETARGYPGVSGSVQTYLRETINQVLSGSRESIVVRISGAEREILREKAATVQQVLSKVAGLVDLHVDGGVDEPVVEVEVNLGKAERAGVKPGDVRRAAATIFSGLEVGFLYEQQKIYEVVVWGVPESRNSVFDIREVLVEKPRPNAGARSYVRLGDVADVRIVPSPTIIKHEGISNYIDVVANVNGRTLGSAAREVEDRLQEVKFPLEYHAVVLGEYAEQQSARNRILGIAIAAAIGIFLLLQVAFGSWRLAAVGVVALPVALIGGVLAAFAAGGVLSLGSLVGFLAVLGIAARSGILLIDRYRQIQRDEGEAFGPGLVLRGARDRFAPTVTTAIVTVLALLPMTMFGVAPGFEIEQPMAVVILGGLVTSTLLTLFVVPALYLHFGGGAERLEEDLMAPALSARAN